MKQTAYLLLLALSYLLVITNVVAQKENQLFTPEAATKIDRAQVSEYAQFSVDQSTLAVIATTQPQQLQINLAFEGGMLLELKRKEILASSFQVFSGSKAQKEAVNYQPGAYYQGKIVGHEQSIVAISFFEDEIIGVLADERGNINFGTLKEKQKTSLSAVAYRESAHQNPPKTTCDSEVENTDNSSINTIPNAPKLAMPLCFTEYLEADFSFYQGQGNNVFACVNWLTGTWNAVSAIFALEEITPTISEIFVWTEPDSYDHTSTTSGLNDFRDAMAVSNFNGDLAHLITRTEGSGGGLAFIRSICNNAPNLRTAYSRVEETALLFPQYSFSTYVLAHEIGHNLGSSHTHRCSWNGNSTQIDDFGNLWAFNEGQFIEGTFCFDEEAPIFPEQGGTIMSYGHLFEEIGLNYALGFGDQPGNVIRNQLMMCPNCNSGFGCTDPDAHNYDSTATNNNGTCLTCFDGEINGDELGVDCGGTKCLPCDDFFYALGGQIRRPDQQGMANFRVRLSANPTPDTLLTDSLGNFIEAMAFNTSSYLIEPLSPAYTPGEPNGVSVLDVVAIQRYILQINDEPLNPYQLLAADVDGNQLITVTDLIHIVQFILAIREDFTTGPPWFFVDADHVFSDPEQPWLDDFPTTRQVNPLEADSLQNDFIAIQRGGVRAASIIAQEE